MTELLFDATDFVFRESFQVCLFDPCKVLIHFELNMVDFVTISRPMNELQTEFGIIARRRYRHEIRGKKGLSLRDGGEVVLVLLLTGSNQASNTLFQFQVLAS